MNLRYNCLVPQNSLIINRSSTGYDLPDGLPRGIIDEPENNECVIGIEHCLFDINNYT